MNVWCTPEVICTTHHADEIALYVVRAFRTVGLIESEPQPFDYSVPAELFMAKRKGGPRQPLRYRRFATAAEAIRFAVEELRARIGCLDADR